MLQTTLVILSGVDKYCTPVLKTELKMWIIFSSCTEEREENKKQSVHPLQVNFLGEQKIP